MTRMIAHISDLHFGRDDPRIARALAAELRSQAPDLVAVSGDLTQRAHSHEFIAARDFLQSLSAPVIAVPGNHDIPLYDIGRRMFRPLRRFRRYISDLRHPSYVDDELAVLGISTARAAAFSNGRVSHDQMEIIRRFFAAVPASALRALVMHHPITQPPSLPERDVVGRAAPALAAILEARVDMLLSGHYHHAASTATTALLPTPHHPILISQAGTAISTRRRKEMNSYHLLRIAEGEVACIRRCWNGWEFTTQSETAFTLRKTG